MNKRGRLLRNLKAIGGNHLTPGRYATLLKLSGFTLDEAVAEIKYLADRDKIKNIQNQIDIICHTYISMMTTPRAVRLMNSKHHTPQEWEMRKLQYTNQCFYCGIKSDHLTKDHIIPVLLGGNDEIGNIVPACMQCNRRKGIKQVESFMEGTTLKLL